MRFLPVLPLMGLLMVCAGTGAHASDRMPGHIPVSESKPDEEKKPIPAAPRSDDRMAGPRTKSETKTQPVKEPKKEDNTAVKPQQDDKVKKTEEEKPEAPAPVVNTPTPNTGITMARREMESLGPLTNPLRGSLGSDMWDGTDRAIVHDYIPRLPDGTTIRAAQYLTRRILLTNGDAKMLRSGANVPDGEDLFTLRIEKLLDTGGYQDAVDLYTLIEGEPSHDRLARAGIMALMLGGAPAQACLEVRSAHRTELPQAEADTFWQQMDSICTFIQRQSVQALARSEGASLSARPVLSKDESTALNSSRVLTALVTRPDYRHPIGSPDDLESLSLMERAVLRSLGRLDYSRLRIRKVEDIPARALMLIAGDPNVTESTRFTFNMEAARRGLLDPSQIGAFYLSLVGNQEDAPGLPGQYLAYTKAEKDSQKAAIAKTLLDNSPGTEESLLSLLPFAATIPQINPADLSAKTIESGLNLMLQAGILPPARWVRAWLAAESGDSGKNREKTLLYLANLLPENLPTESTPFPDETVKELFPTPESAEALEIWSLFSGLGRTNALHNVVDGTVYEKLVDLTVPNDYVMPRDGLVEKIREAARDGRLGEVALLSSVVLKDYKTGTTHPGVLKVLMESLETVGLKEEARHIAMGVMLSSKQ